MDRLWPYFTALILMVICPQITQAETRLNATDTVMEDMYLNATAYSSINYFVPTVIQTHSDGPRQVIVDASANGKRIELKGQDELQVKLEYNSGTGYQWYFDEHASIPSFFEQIGEERIDTGKASRKVGAPIIRILKLKAIRTGKYDLRLSLYRKWEGINRAIKRFEIGVDIN